MAYVLEEYASIFDDNFEEKRAIFDADYDKFETAYNSLGRRLNFKVSGQRWSIDRERELVSI